jgi:SAM-dependent methyltransferase
MTQAPSDRREHDPVRWFDDHFEMAAGTVIDFLGGDGITLEGKQVADIGAGEGVIDLGLAVKGRPANLVGYDIRETDRDALLRAAQVRGVADELPANLSFVQSGTGSIPAPDASFDVVVTWSVFEHVTDVVTMLGEVRRILRPDGVLFLQLWPFYHSEHGGHLWQTYDDPYPHLTRDDESILADTAHRAGTDPTRPADDEYRSLNRIRLEDLHRALLVNQLVVTKFRLMTDTVHVPPHLSYMPLADLGVAGIELLAVPRDVT